jgi:hypothetical protein
VHVAHDHRANGRGFPFGAERTERSLPQVEDDGFASELDEI